MRYLLIVLSLALFAPAAGSGWAQVDLEPVWWSPALGLDSLDRIDERMERSIWADSANPDYAPTMTKRTNAEGEKIEHTVTFRSCAEFLDLAGKGYFVGHGGSDYVLHRKIDAECRVFLLLKDARSSKVSHIGDFVLGTEIMKEVSPLLGLHVSCDFMCRAHVGDHFGVSWLEFEKSTWEGPSLPPYEARIELVSEFEMTIKDETAGYRLSLMATGDFNGDGVRDLLISAFMYVFGGTLGNAKNHILTRDAPDGLLRTVDPDGYLCPQYTCDDYYSHPPVLKQFMPDATGEDRD